MDEQLLKLILAQLQELAEISRSNQVKLERLDTVLATMQDRQKKDEEVLMKDIANIEIRLEKLEKWQVKLLVAASTLAFFIAILWEVLSKLLIPFVT